MPKPSHPSEGTAPMNPGDMSRLSGMDRTGQSALSALAEDHRRVRDLFAEFTEADTPDQRDLLAGEICRELEIHARLEDHLLYPAAERFVELEQIVKDARGAHERIAALVEQVKQLEAGDSALGRLMQALAREVGNHVGAEEHTLFPRLEQRMGGLLDDLGKDIEAYRLRLTSFESL